MDFVVLLSNKLAQYNGWKVISIDCNGTEDHLTMDHIIPRFHGGKNQNNLQPLCYRCNIKKSNKIPKGVTV